MVKYLMFEQSEFEGRLAKCQAQMKQFGMDALILSLGTNVFYMSGYRTQLFFSNFRPFICIIPAEGEPTLGVPNLEYYSAMKECWFEDVQFWGLRGKADDPVSWVVKVLNEKKLTSGTLGMELDEGQRVGMMQSEIESIRAAFPHCEIKSCSQLMWNLRMIKSPRELEFMQEACRITDAGYNALLNVARAGMSEKEIQKVVGETMLAEGGELQGFIVVNTGPERYNMMNPWASDRILKDGDEVVLDWGGVYNGYWSDLTRVFFIGHATEHQQDLYKTTLKLRDTAESVVRPGIPVGEVDRVAMQRVADLGYSEYVQHRSGHAIGLEMHEMPSISADVQTIMEPGMCLTIEPALYDWPDVGSFRIEDLIVVTEDGSKCLSHCTRELIII